MRTIITSRWRCAAATAAGGAIGEMVFAHFTTIVRTAQGGRRLAQRRSDGRRRRVLRGRHSLAAPGRQPRARASSGSKASVRACPSRARQAREEHDGRVRLRQRRGRLAVLLARDSVAAAGAAPVEAVRREGIITFESNGLFVSCAATGFPRILFPGFRDIRGYQAMYRDFHRCHPGGTRAGDEPRAGAWRISG